MTSHEFVSVYSLRLNDDKLHACVYVRIKIHKMEILVTKNGNNYVEESISR